MVSDAVGAQRPGGRTARTRAAVLDALRLELVETGYAATTVEKIAKRAGVAKTTVYRRWGSLDGLVLDLLAQLSTTRIPLPDSGNLDADLQGVAHGILAVYQDPGMRAIIDVVVGAAIHDPAARATLTAFFAARTRQAAEVVRRSIDRGEIPATTDAVEVIRILAAPFYYRMFITGEPIDDGVADRAAATAAHAARAGLVTTRPDGR